MDTVNHFINGKKILGQSSEAGKLYDPSTGKMIGQVSFGRKEEITAAVTAAKNAFPGWAALPPVRRAQVFFKYKMLLEKHIDVLANIITREHGKLINDAKGSIIRGLEIVEFVCGIPNLLKGSYSEKVGTDVDSYTLRQPLGVCVGITPFNFPAMIPLWMFPMAIACGNTFILKPSEKDPSVSLHLAELLQEAGLPDGVLNIVQGDKQTVEGLITHPDVSAVSFVGSTAVAENIYKTASQHFKRVQAFGSGKNHGVVMPDADIDQTAETVIGAAYGSAGERCMALSVLVVVGEDTANKLVEKMIPRIKALKIGAGNENKADFGPLISKEHLARVNEYIDVGVKEGADLVVDGRQLKVPGYESGYFLGGCLFDRVTPHMRIYQEEIFGPVLIILRAPDFETALQWVNDHPYGNGTAIFTRDGGVAHAFASRVKVGMVGINVPIPVPAAYHAFGGWKRSIFADIRMHGMEGVNFYTQPKTIMSRWPAHKFTGAEFSMPHEKR